MVAMPRSASRSATTHRRKPLPYRAQSDADRDSLTTPLHGTSKVLSIKRFPVPDIDLTALTEAFRCAEALFKAVKEALAVEAACRTRRQSRHLRGRRS